MDDRELRSWIETTTGRTVREVERMGYGASRATYLVTMAEGGDLVARVDTGDGPMAGTELSLGREAEVYRALAGTGCASPRCTASRPTVRVLLADRAAGHPRASTTCPTVSATRCSTTTSTPSPTCTWSTPGPSTCRRYRRPVDAPGPRPPGARPVGHDPRDAHHDGRGRWPTTRRAVLRQCAPTTVATNRAVPRRRRARATSSTTARRVTALLDWEFSHLGDPMDDLAWWVFRGHDMRRRLRRPRRAARPVVGADRAARRRRQHRVLPGLRDVPLAGVGGRRPSTAAASGMDRSVHFALVPVLAVRLPQALATLLGVDPATTTGDARRPAGPGRRRARRPRPPTSPR